jgi:cullin 3
LVLHKHGELLYDGVYEVVAEQLRSVARSILETQNDLLLEKLVTQWNHHKVIMTMIRDILMYMVCVLAILN